MSPQARRAAFVVAVWLVTKVLLLGSVAVANWSRIEDGGWRAYLRLWSQWDTTWFQSIVTTGYAEPYGPDYPDYVNNIAFFPGLPLVMEVGRWVGSPAVLTGLIVSAAASLVAAFAIGRLTEGIGGRAEWGVTAFLVAPTALFLTAAYTEALFAALAFWAWVVARKGSWVWAGVLAGGAALVRSNGLFLMAGLLVMFLLTRPWTTDRPAREWLRGSALLLPAVATLGYFAFLHAVTGSWTAWFEAQTAEWERGLVAPWTALANTWGLVFTFDPDSTLSTRYLSELVGMVILLGVVVAMAGMRLWPEAFYALVTAAALGTSTTYHSVPRTLVVIFPMWMLLGLLMTRRPWTRWVYVAICVPLLVLVTVRFTQGQWIS